MIESTQLGTGGSSLPAGQTGCLPAAPFFIIGRAADAAFRIIEFVDAAAGTRFHIQLSRGQTCSAAGRLDPPHSYSSRIQVVTIARAGLAIYRAEAVSILNLKRGLAARQIK